MPIPEISDAEILVGLHRQAVRYRTEGNYERAKLTDDCIDLLDQIADIWRRIGEAASGAY